MTTVGTPTKRARKPGITEARQALLDTAAESIGTAKDALQELLDDLEEKKANMEEHFSQTERYQRFESACEVLEELIGTLDGLECGVELP